MIPRIEGRCFDFATSGAGGQAAATPGFSTLDLKWDASASEYPTFSIVPVSGQDFTRCLLTPLPKNAYLLPMLILTILMLLLAHNVDAGINPWIAADSYDPKKWDSAGAQTANPWLHPPLLDT